MRERDTVIVPETVGNMLWVAVSAGESDSVTIKDCEADTDALRVSVKVATTLLESVGS